MWRGISLANKCLLLFGGAVVLIVLAALLAPWFRMNALVDDGQLDVSRQLVGVWERLGPDESDERAGIVAHRLTVAEAEARAAEDPFLRRAMRIFTRDAERADVQQARWRAGNREYRYVKAVRTARADDDPGPLVGLVLLERKPVAATRLLAINTLYLLSAGCFVLALAVLVFYLVTNRLVLSPVRQLKRTAEQVREGELSTRSSITTGDEFQELSETFNAMLAELQTNQDQLRAINAAMDLKLNELAESNVALYEAYKLKGEFLANVTHELRTPLNSIIGFAELLLEIAQVERNAGDDSSRLGKRIRYLENIVRAGRDLLDMINGLLEMAKIEAGRIEVKPEPMSLHEACEGLLGLVQPQAQRKEIELKLEVQPNIPIIETDVRKFQQIIFNLLSNAVKFTRRDGTDHPVIILRAELLHSREAAEDGAERVRVSVIDSGPGIAPEDQRRIFEKFEQIDGGQTREHAGTGLGLAISKELALMIQGEIQLVSDVGRGSMFSLILPIRLDRDLLAEATLEARFRGALAGRRAEV